MIRLRPPSGSEIKALLGSEHLALSYPEVGATAKLGAPGIGEALSTRYDIDRHRFTLGNGRALFERARSSLLSWRHFEISWLRFHGSTPVVSSQIVATVARVAGLWFLNPCRVVYTEPVGEDTVAYAYGTLGGHTLCGEERFQVSFNPGSGEVSYEIVAFSRPAILLSKMGYPIAQRLQRRFAKASADALARAAA